MKNQQNSKSKVPNPKIYQIDAEDQPIGRVASQIAQAVQGKLLASYAREKLSFVLVVVQNANKMTASGKKWEKKKYYHFSGYPGGLKEKSLNTIFKTSPEKFLLTVVRKMLPKNKLRGKMLKRIRFKKK